MDDADQSLSGICFRAMETNNSTTYYYLVPKEENNTAALLCSPSRKKHYNLGLNGLSLMRHSKLEMAPLHAPAI
jgi:hypothetical protein